MKDTRIRELPDYVAFEEAASQMSSVDIEFQVIPVVGNETAPLRKPCESV